MKYFLSSACMAAALIVSVPAQARDISDISVGDYVCYNRIGPIDTFGTVTSKNYGDGTVTLQKINGGTGSYPAKKITSPTYCNISKELQQWALRFGYNLLTGEKD